jgi:hypothetical protein
MTRRERLERKIEKREEWAEKARARSDSAASRVAGITAMIPLGQPILVGHHSERHARKDVDRIHNGMRKAVDEQKKAEHHEAKAEGLAAQLASTIFSDDENAIEALRAKIASIETECEQAKKTNAAWKRWRKSGDTTELIALGFSEEKIPEYEKVIARSPYNGDRPFPDYYSTNRRAEIRRCKARIVEIERRAKVTAAAEAAPNGVLCRVTDSGYAVVTFAEKPKRSMINALKGAGFFWSGGAWNGKNDALPECVKELLE